MTLHLLNLYFDGADSLTQKLALLNNWLSHGGGGGRQRGNP